MSSIVQITLEDNEYLIKQSELIRKREPNYLRIGNGTMNKNKIQSIDLLTEQVTMSVSGRWLIAFISRHINYDNDYNPVVKIVNKNLTSTEQDYLKNGYKELHEKGLVKRIKQSHYMINPNALIPLDYPAALAVWNSVD